MKQRNARRKGSSFPEQRQGDFTRWLTTEHPCMLRGSTIRAPFSTHDFALPQYGYIHECWSSPDRPPIDPAHVGRHRAKGAPDMGATVPLCHSAHAYYDEHRSNWERVTRWTADAMQGAAEDYAREYVERGGAPSPDPQL